MPSFTYIAIGAVCFLVGYLIKRHSANKIISDLHTQISNANASYNAKVSEEVSSKLADATKKLASEYEAREHKIKENCRRENARLKSEYDDELNREMLRLEKYYSNIDNSLSLVDIDNLKSSNNNLVAELNDTRNLLIQAQDKSAYYQKKYEDIARESKNAIESIQHAWYLDAQKRNSLLDETNLAHAAELDRRREEQFEMLSQVQEASYAPEVKSRLCAALESITVPDLSKGAVYVKRDLSSRFYHHADHCTGDLVLASKVFVEKAGLRPCACVHVAPQPDHDETVFRSSFTSRVYHRVDCRHMFNSDPSTHRPLGVAEALHLGLHPCSACKPPDEPPYQIFF